MEDQLSIEASEGKSSGQVTREEERERGPIFSVEEVGQPRVLSMERCAMNSWPEAAKRGSIVAASNQGLRQISRKCKDCHPPMPHQAHTPCTELA